MSSKKPDFCQEGVRIYPNVFLKKSKIIQSK